MWVAGKPGSKPHPSNQLHPDVGVLISGCCDSETSADSTSPADPSRACGAMTNAVVSVVRDHYYNYPSTPLTNRSACLTLNKTLARKSYCACQMHIWASYCSVQLCSMPFPVADRQVCKSCKSSRTAVGKLLVCLAWQAPAYKQGVTCGVCAVCDFSLAACCHSHRQLSGP